jgi:flavodoxin short chain
MSKIAVVYWSGTGNTEQMANLISRGITEAGAEAEVLTASQFSVDMMKDYEKIAFGCPSMGAEQLEETEFEPMFVSVESELKGKKIVLFGSYGWGDGEWMRNWEETCRTDGAVLIEDPLIVNNAPDEESGNACKALGTALVSA